ncbi:MAG: hypothetical protein H6595_11895 [Flavobacteriales bacterium]|nr:hypothetical protein [Flavobacteriales bacterium]MCB9168163.1 hypothetical protein [Flavobacteriales bacterium]MCB9194272.1 hypothetical protein [Flavobacteriales bacterium]
MHFDLATLRTALIITLGLLVLVLLWQRFKLRVLRRELPVARHIDILRIEVAYHPSRIRVQVIVPHPRSLRTALLDNSHGTLGEWPLEEARPGEQWLERSLEGRPDGEYYFELRTASQRTVRRFRLSHS